ncbi:MAG: glycine cleavage system protein T [Gammaproteobacteria bacterium]|nr:glycine cleavage system protein T [Gammaproteobacteria bacterium]
MSDVLTKFEFQMGPRYRKSPFFEATRRHGCKSWGIYNHMYIPNYYNGAVEDYRALTENVTLWDVSVERIVEITGPDASEFTNRLTCRDLTKCSVGQGKYVLITAEDGGIVNEPVLLRLEENRWWLALADSDAGLWARGYSVGCGLDVKVREPEIYPVQVQGPKSVDVMVELFGDEVKKIRYYWTLQTDLDGIPVVISRTGWSAEIGYEIYLCDPSRGDAMYERIMEVGQPHGIQPIAPSQIRRVEAGIFRYGADLTIENNPYEIMGFERLVDDQSADYIGKEALMRIKEEGVSQKLVGTILDAEEEIPGCPDVAPIYRNGEEIGKVTLILWSPRMQRNIGYVWVPIDLADPGNQIEVTTLHGTTPAKTAAVPFFDPRKSVPSRKLSN